MPPCFRHFTVEFPKRTLTLAADELGRPESDGLFAATEICPGDRDNSEPDPNPQKGGDDGQGTGPPLDDLRSLPIPSLVFSSQGGAAEEAECTNTANVSQF
jgi:hypothetical protein